MGKTSNVLTDWSKIPVLCGTFGISSDWLFHDSVKTPSPIRKHLFMNIPYLQAMYACNSFQSCNFNHLKNIKPHCFSQCAIFQIRLCLNRKSNLKTGSTYFAIRKFDVLQNVFTIVSVFIILRRKLTKWWNFFKSSKFLYFNHVLYVFS